MKNVTKRLLTFALALVVAVTAFGTVSAEAALKDGKNYNKKQTVYLSDKKSGYGYASLSVSNLSKSQTIIKNTVKSSNKTVAIVESLGYSTSASEYYEDSSYDWSSYSYSINLYLKSDGKATISFKVKNDNTKYSTVLTVKKYENPISSATITGIKSDNKSELNSKTNNQRRVYLTNKKTIKNVKATFKTKKNWSITNVRYSDDSKYHSYYGSTSKKNMTVPIGTLTKNKFSSICVECYNTDTKAYIDVYYYFN